MNIMEAKQILHDAGYTLTKENCQIDEGIGSFLKKVGTTAALIGALASAAMAHPATTGEQPTRHNANHWDLSTAEMNKSMNNKMDDATARNVAKNIRDIAQTVQGEKDSNGWATFDGGKARVERDGVFTVVFDNGTGARYYEQRNSKGAGMLQVQDSDGNFSTYKVKEFTYAQKFDINTGKVIEEY